jgi:L-ascorbate metabolism protein UlaG (beta-lactamase superfamily)
MPAIRTIQLPAERVPTFHGSPAEEEGEGSALNAAALASVAGSTRFGGTVQWIGNATCLLEYHGLRILTDPNFLHAGGHVHLGPGVTAQRLHEPAFPLERCPPVDFVLLSHLHGDHFDDDVARMLRRDIPIVTTPSAAAALASMTGDNGLSGFTNTLGLETWDAVRVQKAGVERPVMITSMPGKHTIGVFDKVNELLNAIPPVMGSLVEFEKEGGEKFTLYISGDTLYYDELEVNRSIA